jgi:hypothetical protein
MRSVVTPAERREKRIAFILKTMKDYPEEFKNSPVTPKRLRQCSNEQIAPLNRCCLVLAKLRRLERKYPAVDLFRCMSDATSGLP